MLGDFLTTEPESLEHLENMCFDRSQPELEAPLDFAPKRFGSKMVEI